MKFHPWRRLRGRPELTVVWQKQPAGRLACTDGRFIYVDPRLSQVQRRCAITHEQVHVDMGHIAGCSTSEERAVRAETARQLIEMPDLLSAYRWADRLHEVADELWVTPEVLQDRIDHLTHDETTQLVQLYRELEPR
ncbi:ImmA/IrrE family metallo-endopeptidase [Cellulomonas sp. RIT-PI-Y]|uniref:ImmA/IrrE family metallo-endopeptidase n=1 Tax=Cellulomonas sp. RIT-PI-Y TaxID=3035297 RepID=UPI0021D8DDF2|nr:ImmA/IrrE family metallo-endopeptidase [Cellulomonas sp. RIT-PI-Y]